VNSQENETCTLLFSDVKLVIFPTNEAYEFYDLFRMFYVYCRNVYIMLSISGKSYLFNKLAII
jgi:hypothetical protein